jgi:phosphatidate cytidylyltransferase
MKRLITAAVALPLLLFILWSPSPYAFAGLVALALIIALSEFYHLATRIGAVPQRILGYAASIFICAAFALDHRPWIIACLIGLMMASFCVALVQPAQLRGSIVSISTTVAGVVYVCLLPACLIGVRMLSDTQRQPPVSHLAPKLLTMFFAMVMLTDTGAYYVGRSFGRRKLAPLISPGKTVEGAIGGFIFAVITGPLCRLVFFPEINLLQSVLLGAAIGIVGQIGDLAESLLKRAAEVKDSGALLPGHGGMLDRIDSILFCAPVLYYYTRFFLL